MFTSDHFIINNCPNVLKMENGSLLQWNSLFREDGKDSRDTDNLEYFDHNQIVSEMKMKSNIASQIQPQYYAYESFNNCPNVIFFNIQVD